MSIIIIRLNNQLFLSYLTFFFIYKNKETNYWPLASVFDQLKAIVV
jgi:hypothetical protein